MESNKDSFIYTVAEAAKELKIGRTAMYELVMSGEVRSVTIGRSRRVPAVCIKEYVMRLLTDSEEISTAA